MTERDYLNASNLGRVTSLMNVLKEIKPQEKDTVPVREFETVMQIVMQWQWRLFQVCKTEEATPGSSHVAGSRRL
jgi:hypothetical protein